MKKTTWFLVAGVLILSATCALPVAAQKKSGAIGKQLPDKKKSGLHTEIDSYIDPYVRTNNFSGDVLVEQNGAILFHWSYGYADRAQKLPITHGTKFHIASTSMQFTAAAILRLVDDGKLKLSSSVSGFAPEIFGAEKITVGHLLTEKSGLPDINALPNYDDLLQQHHTPADLVAAISGRALLFEPGSKYVHEEHSAYNVLALIVEKTTGLPFATAVRDLVFRPLDMKNSFEDDDAQSRANVAVGYEPVGLDDVKPASPIHWSAKAGNASTCTTAADEAAWIRALFGGHALTASSSNAMLDAAQSVGYGWFKSNPAFGEPSYSMNGRAPGFGSFVLYLPREKLTVVLFSNIYSSATTAMGYDLANILLDRPHGVFRPGVLSAAEAKTYSGRFQFGSDFYQKSAVLEFVSDDSGLALRWPSRSLSPLIPLSRDRFIDRTYWEKVSIERDAAGKANVLVYGDFRGAVVQ